MRQLLFAILLLLLGPQGWSMESFSAQAPSILCVSELHNVRFRFNEEQNSVIAETLVSNIDGEYSVDESDLPIRQLGIFPENEDEPAMFVGLVTVKKVFPLLIMAPLTKGTLDEPKEFVGDMKRFEPPPHKDNQKPVICSARGFSPQE